MLIVFIRAIILYVLIVFSVRLMGKRQIGELQPSELVITILVSNIATLPIEDITIPMVMGVVPILTLVCLDVIMSALTLKFRGLRRIVSGMPKIIISDGKIDQILMKKLRFSVDDLMEALRSQSIFDICDVQLAVVETTGKISVYQKPEKQPCTPENMRINVPDANPPQLVVDSGIIIENAVKYLGLDMEWLENVLEKEKCFAGDIFLMTANCDGSYTLIRKADK